MNEELQRRISSYLDAIETYAQGAGEFATEQAPLVAQEYLSWMFWSSLLTIAACALVITVCTCIMYSAVRYIVRSKDSWDDHPQALFLVFPIMFIFFSAVHAVDNIHVAVKVKVAPRVVLLEKVVELSRR
jgi:hypothetical protein